MSTVYLVHGFQGEHVLGIYSTREKAIEAAQADARKLDEPEDQVLLIGGEHDLDGYTVEEFTLDAGA